MSEELRQEYHAAVCAALDTLRSHDKGEIEERTKAWSEYNATMHDIHLTYLFHVGGENAVCTYIDANERLTGFRAARGLALALRSVGSKLEP